MALGQTGVTQLTHSDLVKYNKALLFAAEQEAIFNKYGLSYEMQNNEGERSKWRKYSSLPEGVALAEGVNPAAYQLAKTDVYADLLWYGLVVNITERVNKTNQDKVYGAASKLLGRSAAKTRDSYVRGILNGGSNVYYANNVAGRTDIVAKLSATDLDRIILSMQNLDAEYFQPTIKAGTGIGTAPIPDSYFMLTSYNACMDAKNILGTSWKPVETYASQGGIERNEMGAYGRIRFIATSNPFIAVDGGGSAVSASLKYTTSSSHCDVHTGIILSKEAYGFVALTGTNPQMIIKDASVVGGPLEVFGTAGYKLAIAAAILDDNKMYRYEFGVSA